MSSCESPSFTQPPSLLIFPCNGNGIEALNCVGSAYTMLGFVDDTPAKQGAKVHGQDVHSRAAFDRWPDAMVLAVPGSPASYLTRSSVVGGLGIDPARFASVVHPSAQISSMASIGRNVLVMAGVVITSNAVIGDHVCLLPNTVVHHDARIGAWTLVGSNVTIAGGALIGQNCYIGSGSSIMNGLRIGDCTLVGLGSNVIRSPPPGSRIAGNPAGPIA